MQSTGIQLVLIVVVGALAGVGGALAVDSMREVPAPRRVPPTALSADAVALEARVARLEQARLRPAPESMPTEARETDDEEQSTIEIEVVPAKESILDGLLDDGLTMADVGAMHTRLSKHRGSIDSTIRELEKAIAEDSRNADLRCALAVAWSAKTAYDTPSGPQQGVTWAKAVSAYNEALKIDTNHWQARYGLAFGSAMAPEFTGLRPMAIRQFEELMVIQEGQSPHGDHVQVYMQLGNLYKGAGNVKKARAVWLRGLERHPDGKGLHEALDLLPKD